MKLIDRVVNRLAGKTVAKAGPCQPEQYSYCVPSGVCPGGHAKYLYRLRSDCTESYTFIGCC